MTIELNHTIVHSRDPWAAARDVAAVLGTADPSAYGPFAVVELDNGASLDFLRDDGEVTGQHYAFLVGEDDFDAIWGRLRDQDRTWWADPFRRRPGEISHEDGGRGLYWEGPDGHWLEIITRPYGSGAEEDPR
jgi:catechol 2,3-dioxygenase-like lactoylglutathione lyase family enzyme